MFILFLLLTTTLTSLTFAAPPQPMTPAPQSLNDNVACAAIPYMGVIPADCTRLLDNLDDFADWPDEYIDFGILGPGGRETPVFVQVGYCRVGVVAILPERRPVERMRLKDYMSDLRRINRQCLLGPSSRWNAGRSTIGEEGKFYAYLGGVPIQGQKGVVNGEREG